jgi:hypothetical protein
VTDLAISTQETKGKKSDEPLVETLKVSFLCAIKQTKAEENVLGLLVAKCLKHGSTARRAQWGRMTDLYTETRRQEKSERGSGEKR